MVINMDYTEILEQVYKAPAFIPWLGIKVVEMKEGYCKGELEVRPEFANPLGMVHGGCIFSFADTIGGLAATSRNPEVKVVTLNSSINYLKPAVDTKKLIAESREIKYGSKVAVYEVNIYNDSEELLANVNISYFIL